MPPPTKRQKREEYRKTHLANPNTSFPQKKFYRQRAHANPFSDHQLTYPTSPSQMDWSPHYPAFISPHATSSSPAPLTKPITIADIGCGFGGLLVALSPLLPSSLILGLEIRTQVTEYVQDRIAALRAQHAPPPSPSISTSPSPSLPFSPLSSPAPGPYQNISTLRTNTMKFLPNFFSRSQLTHIFLCFPDPHFKTRKHKARIVSETLCAEYAFVLRPGGWVFTITDVEELAGWMAERLGGFGRTPGGKEVGDGGGEGLFEKVDVPEEGEEGVWEAEGGERAEVARLVRVVREETEEGKKVGRNGGRKFVGVWRRRGDPKWPGE